VDLRDPPPLLLDPPPLLLDAPLSSAEELLVKELSDADGTTPSLSDLPNEEP